MKKIDKFLVVVEEEGLVKGISEVMRYVLKKAGILGILNSWRINSLEDTKNLWEKNHERAGFTVCGGTIDIETIDTYLNPDKELNERIRKHLDPEKKNIRILDVGSGPVTKLGYNWGNRDIEIEAVDVNADNYIEKLKEHNRSPGDLFTLKQGKAEELSELYEEKVFDVIWSSNAIDHGYNAMKAIEEMSKLVKPGCFILLKHFRNEGKEQGYSSGHLWNFDCVDGKVIISNPSKEYVVNEELGKNYEVSCDPYTAENGKESLFIKIKKLSD